MEPHGPGRGAVGKICREDVREAGSPGVADMRLKANTATAQGHT